MQVVLVMMRMSISVGLYSKWKQMNVFKIYPYLETHLSDKIYSFLKHVYRTNFKINSGSHHFEIYM